MVLIRIVSAITRFLVTLVGALFTADDGHVTGNMLGIMELAILGIAVLFRTTHCGLVFRAISNLGISRASGLAQTN